MKHCVIGSVALLVIGNEVLSLLVIGVWAFIAVAKLFDTIAENNIF